MYQLKYNNFNQEKIIGNAEDGCQHIIHLPDPPDLRCVMNYNLAQEKQKFYRTEVPKGIEQWPEKDRLAFEAKEWDKRDDGLWFFNNGRLEYISGANYLFINNWRVESGFPRFTDAQQDVFLLWKYKVDLNPISRGLVFITSRRFGKTHIGNCIGYDKVAKLPEVQHMGIQSKSNDDAKGVFDKLILSWKYLPYYYKPVDIGISDPISSLQFREPSKKDTKNQKKSYGISLNSYIDYKNSKEIAYDGKRLEYCVQDEIGKDEENDVYKRIQVVKECVWDEGIIGKIFATTTVEEMEKGGGENCRLVWDSADPHPENLMPNGETQLGLIRYFNPAYYGNREKDPSTGESFVDEFGYTNVERSKAYLEQKLKSIKNKDLQRSQRRKYPLTINDCFIYDDKKSIYDIDRIEAQIEYNRTLPANMLRRGNFYRKGGEKDGQVDFNDDPNGKFLISWMPKPEDRNKFTWKGGMKVPGNIEAGCFGLDPYDNKTTVDDRKSDAAAYGFRRLDPMEPQYSGCFVMEYVNRPKLPEIMWEDMIMMCQFYGWEILIENNKIGTINYFRMRGYDKYLMYRPDETQTASSVKMKEPGIPLSGQEARLALIYATEAHINEKVGLIERVDGDPYPGWCPFDKLLKNWKLFDFDKEWTKFDSMVGAGLALLGARNKLPKKIGKKAFRMFPMFKNNGKVSRAISAKELDLLEKRNLIKNDSK